MKTVTVLLMAVVAVGLAPADEKTATEKWSNEISTLEKKWAAAEQAPGGALFVGSSSIRLWKLKDSFPELAAANHGFGGSEVSDSVLFFDRIVLPVKPRVIVLYAGDNDIASGKSPETICDDVKRFFELVSEKLPDCQRVVYIAIKPSVKRWNLKDQQLDANERIKELCRESGDRFTFLDIWPLMLNAEGTPRPELLVEDGLHLNADGYKIWSEALSPHLK